MSPGISDNFDFKDPKVCNTLLYFPFKLTVKLLFRRKQNVQFQSHMEGFFTLNPPITTLEIPV